MGNITVRAVDSDLGQIFNSREAWRVASELKTWNLNCNTPLSPLTEIDGVTCHENFSGKVWAQVVLINNAYTFFGAKPILLVRVVSKGTIHGPGL